eukprot:jgi/Ulvmu1/8421/UM042_0128.1
MRQLHTPTFTSSSFLRLRRRLDVLGLTIKRRSSAAAPGLTISESVQQARTAFRSFREDIKDGKVTKAKDEHPYCCRIQIPLPHPEDEDTIRVLDEGEFPGGVRQKFRELRPRAEDILFGYNPEFVGMVRDAADGVGVWKCSGITAIANVNTLTFESLLELCEGAYGAAPTRSDHVVLAINCSWGPSSDIGQFWQKDLKRRAAAVIEERTWHDAFHHWPLRTVSGRAGWLYHTWGAPWQVYACADEEGTQRGGLLRSFTEGWAAGAQSLRPEASAVAEALAAGPAPGRKPSIRLW